MSELTVVCCGCQRLKVAEGVFVEAPPPAGPASSISHSICPDCRTRFYPNLPRRAA